MGGPALAGLVIAAFGGYGAMWINALSFSAALIAVMMLPALKKTSSGATASGVFVGMVEGFRWLWGNAVIKVLSLQAMIGNFGFGMVSAVLMFYLRTVLGLTSEISGLNYSMLGVGGIIGSLAIVPLTRRFRRGRLYPAMLPSAWPACWLWRWCGPGGRPVLASVWSRPATWPGSCCPHRSARRTSRLI